MPSGTRAVRAVIALCMIAPWATGCGTVVDPELSPSQDVVDTYNEDQSLPNAVKIGESMRAQYAGKVQDQILLDRSVGLVLIGAVASVVGLGATGGPATAIIATSLGAGALYGADTFISNKPLQFTYAAGANAVQCALDTMQPMVIAYQSRDRLVALINGDKANKVEALAVKIGNVQQLMNGYPEIARSPVYFRGAAAVESARSIQQPARNALNAMNTAGGTLRSSLASIELQVTNAVINNSPSISALAEALGVSLPAIGKAVPVPPMPSMDKNKAVSTSNNLDQPLTDAAIDLEQTVAEITTIISAVNEQPSADKLKTCNVNLDQAGLTMTISPAGEVTVAAPSGDVPNRVIIEAENGILPYRPSKWIGAVPPSDTIGIETETGQGTTTITVKKGAPAGTYGVQIQDGANGLATTSVRVTAAAAATASAASAPATACARDDDVAKVQTFLIEKQNITQASVNGTEKTLTVDGCYGDVTAAAIRRFFKEKQNFPDDQIPTDRKTLLDDALEFANQV